MRLALDKEQYSCADRPKNMYTLSMLGWKWDDAVDELRDLSYRDYICGPEIDVDYPYDDEFWIFKRLIQRHVIYIKLKIRYSSDRSVLLFSFHLDHM